MLVMTRKPGEAVIIRENGRHIATVHVLERKGRLGFEADECVEILREEIDAVKYPEDHEPQEEPQRDSDDDAA